MVRKAYFDNNGVKKGAWSPQEDQRLINYITRYGHWNWRQLPKFAGLKRCGKSCRLRWMNYLRPDVKRGNYTKEEEDLIIKLHRQLGNKWSKIAAQFPGRTDNEIKNHWHTQLKKKLMKKKKKLLSKGRKRQSIANILRPKSGDCSKHIPSDVPILESYPLPSIQQSSNDEISKMTTSETADNTHLQSANDSTKVSEESITTPSNIFAELDGGFWSEPLVFDSFDILYDDFQMINNFVDHDVLLSPCESYYQEFDFHFQAIQELALLDHHGDDYFYNIGDAIGI